MPIFWSVRRMVSQSEKPFIHGRIAAGLLFQQREGGLGAVGLHGLHAGQAQVQRDHLADAGFVLHNKYFDHGYLR